MNTAIMAVGRRKTSNARVMLKPGTGKCTVSNKDITTYFPRGTHRLHILEAMKVVEIGSQYDVHANVAGGGLSGQAGAIRAASEMLNQKLTRTLTLTRLGGESIGFPGRSIRPDRFHDSPLFRFRTEIHASFPPSVRNRPNPFRSGRIGRNHQANQ